MTGDLSNGRHHEARPVAQSLSQRLRRFLVAEEGSTAIEYGLIVTFVALMLVGFLNSFGEKLSGFFLSLAGAIRTS